MIILISALATLSMTAFSYLCSYLTGNQFKEPELLQQLLNSSRLPVNSTNNFLGWLLHFLLGVVFAASLVFTRSYFSFYTTWIFAIIAGAIAGIIGIIGWHGMFLLNPKPPKISMKKFYLQLIIAHIIFSVTIFGFLIIFDV